MAEDDTRWTEMIRLDLILPEGMYVYATTTCPCGHDLPLDTRHPIVECPRCKEVYRYRVVTIMDKLK